MPKTIIILGAGASYPYGFPLGKELIEHVIDFTKKSHSDTTNLYFLLKQRFAESDIEKFRKHLASTDVNSIDFFLSHNPDYLEIGKACIAYILLECEAKLTKDIIDESDHWYKYFWNEIASREPENFDFKIYTYNYDRSLFYYLKSQTELLFPNAEKRDSYLDNIDITHLHGSIGKVDFGQISLIENYSDLKSVADNIKIISEAVNDESFKNFKKDIKNSNHIVFLGFGYHEDNMKRMGFFDERFEQLPYFYASVYNLKSAEIETKLKAYLDAAIHYHFNAYVLSEEYYTILDAKNLEFLREIFPLHNLLKS